MKFNFGSMLKHSLFVALTSFTLFASNVLAQVPLPNNLGRNAPMEASAAIFFGVLGITTLLKLRGKRR